MSSSSPTSDAAPGGPGRSGSAGAGEKPGIGRVVGEDEARLRLALAVADIGTTAVDLATGTYHFDARAREILGFDAAEVEGPEVEARVHPDDAAEFMAVRRRATSATEGSDDLHHTFRFLGPDGGIRWVTVHARVLFEGDEDGRRPVKAVGAFLDVTTQIRTETELRRTRDAAERASRAKDQFLSTVSHELRTPLAAVVGYVELLKEEIPGPVNEAQRDCLERIEASANHQLAIVDEILTYSRTEAGEEQVQLEEADVARITRETGEMLSGLFATEGIELELHGADAPVLVRTDPEKVRMIVTNLVGNALKYTEEGRVDVEVEDGDDRVEVRVRDTGPGIPADQMEDIFRPFTQVDQSHTRPQGGTGLGLAICQRLAELVGGTVTVRSVLGEGSIFALRLPRNHAQES